MPYLFILPAWPPAQRYYSRKSSFCFLFTLCNYCYSLKGPEYLRHDNPYRNLRLSWVSTLFPTSKFIVSLLIRTPVLLGTESSISLLILPIDRSHHCLVIPERLTVIWFLMVTLGTSCWTAAQNPDRFLYNCPFPKSDFMPCLDYSVTWMWCTPHDSWKKWENSRKEGRTPVINTTS